MKVGENRRFWHNHRIVSCLFSNIWAGNGLRFAFASNINGFSARTGCGIDSAWIIGDNEYCKGIEVFKCLDEPGDIIIGFILIIRSSDFEGWLVWYMQILYRFLDGFIICVLNAFFGFIIAYCF